MKISTKSWHYRFMSFADVKPYWRRDLCSYIRGLLLAFTKVILLGGCAASFLGFLVFSMVYAILSGWINMPIDPVFWVVGVLCWGVSCCLGAAYVIMEVRDRRPSRPYKEPGVIRQYLKDRHAKICRMIEFT